jgi:hypothetical protein
MGRNALKALSGREKVYRANGPSRPSMGHEFVGYKVRIARWRLCLAEFYFEVEYNPGSAHHVADALSRLTHQPVPKQPIDLDIPVFALNEDPLSPIE